MRTPPKATPQANRAGQKQEQKDKIPIIMPGYTAMEQCGCNKSVKNLPKSRLSYLKPLNYGLKKHNFISKRPILSFSGKAWGN